MQKVGKQVKNESERHWTKQEKRNYLNFIVNNVSQLKQRAPRNFFAKMANAISNNKNSKQCNDFHTYRKNTYSQLKDLIEKVAKQIDEDPSEFLKSHEQMLKRKIEKKKNFEGLQTFRPIEEVAVQDLMKDFNPHEIIFKPDKILAKQQQVTEKKPLHPIWDCDNFYYRPLQSKIYSLKNESSNGESETLNQNDRMIDEAEEQRSSSKVQKKQILLQKRRRKIDSTQVQLASSHQSWTERQRLKSLVFLVSYKNYFVTEDQRQKMGIYNKMSSFIKTRDPNRCRYYVQNLQKDKNDIDGIDDAIDNLQRVIDVTKEQIQEQIQNIQEFYQGDIDEQCNALNPTRFSLNLFGNKNKKLLQKIVNSTNIQERIKKIKENNLEINSQTNEGKNQNLELELSILMTIPQIKSTQINQTQEENRNRYNIKKHQKIKKLEKQQSNIQKKKTFKNHIHFSENDLSQSQIEKQRNLPHFKKNQKWSVSENIKCVAYLMVNRRFFQMGGIYQKAGIYLKLSKFLGTEKSQTQCSDHFRNLKKYKNRSSKQVIDEQAKRYGITEQMIKERIQICKLIKTSKLKIGNVTLEIDHLPQIITIKKADFSEKQVVNKIYEAEPYLSFYLTQEENQHSQEKYFFEDEVDSLEISGDKKLQNSSELTTRIKLEVPEKRFQKLKKNLSNLNPLKTGVICNTESYIGIRLRLKQTYKLIVQK